MTQQELREMLIERTIRGQQQYIAQQAGISKNTLSRFKMGKIYLYPDLFAKLENYLVNNSL